MKEKLDFKKGIKDGLPIALGYLPVSFAFGVQASILCVPVLISVLISMTNLTSAGQLAGLSVIAVCGPVLEIVATQLVINLRYALMSLALSQKTDDSFTLSMRLLTGAFITDEIFAVAASKKGLINTRYFFGLALLPYIFWAVGTALGALAGNVLPQSVTNALGIALYAMFIAIIVPPSAKERGVLFVVAVAAAVSCAFYFIPFLSGVSSGFSIIIAAVAASLIVAAIFPVKDDAMHDGSNNDGNNFGNTDNSKNNGVSGNPCNKVNNPKNMVNNEKPSEKITGFNGGDKENL